MPEHPPRLTAEELESLREATLQRYVAADRTYAETGRLRAYTDEPDGGLINLIDMAIELARSHEAALARIAELEAERPTLGYVAVVLRARDRRPQPVLLGPWNDEESMRWELGSTNGVVLAELSALPDQEVRDGE